MAFNDIKGVSYKQLIEHTQKVKPYKDTNGAYNLGYRKYSDRHYRVRNDGVIEVFFSYMGSVKTRIAQNEFDTTRHLANIHPDNSIEFVNYNGQGDIMFLSALFPYVTHSKAHHGLLLRSYKNRVLNISHPAFKRGRFHLESHETMTPYILQPKVVDIKKRREVIARFDTFKKVAVTMFNAMSPLGIFEVYKDMWKEHGEEYMNNIQPEMVVATTNEGKHLDALLMSTLVKGEFGWWTLWRVRQLILEEERSGFSEARVGNFFGDEYKKNVNEAYLDLESRVSVNNILIKGSPDAFKYKDPIPNGQAIPSSKWGYRLTDMAGNNLIRL